jgi:TatD DNase family protein
MRGKQNHPKNIEYIASYLADLRQTSMEVIAHQTTSNAIKIFNFNGYERAI